MTKIFLFWSALPLCSDICMFVRTCAFAPNRDNLLLPIPNRNCIFNLFVFTYMVIITMLIGLWKMSSVPSCHRDWKLTRLWNPKQGDIFYALVKISFCRTDGVENDHHKLKTSMVVFNEDKLICLLPSKDTAQGAAWSNAGLREILKELQFLLQIFISTLPECSFLQLLSN